MLYSFKLASMSPLMLGFTVALWLLAAIAGVVALVTRQGVAVAVFGILLVIYGSVWFGCRPSHFVITENSLDIVFPVWRRPSIPLTDITTARRLSDAQFRKEFGWAIRIGAGGLWGGFGWLQTAHRGLIEFYISRADEFVLIERAQGRNLLITPDRPTEVIELLTAPSSNPPTSAET